MILIAILLTTFLYSSVQPIIYQCSFFDLLRPLQIEVYDLNDIHFDCQTNITIYSIEMFSATRIIYNKILDLSSLSIKAKLDGLLLTFRYFNGLDIEINYFTNYERSIQQITIKMFKFNFYYRNKKINTFCLNSSFYSDINFFNSTKVSFINNIYDKVYCPYLFSNSMIGEIDLRSFSNTFLRKNLLSFLKLNKTDLSINSTIKYISLTGYHIDIDFSLINEKVYQEIITFEIRGIFNLIEDSLFIVFTHLQLVLIDTPYLLKLLYKSNKFIENLNFHVDYIDTLNLSTIYQSLSLHKALFLQLTIDTLLDEDFVFLKNFLITNLCFQCFTV